MHFHGILTTRELQITSVPVPSVAIDHDITRRSRNGTPKINADKTVTIRVDQEVSSIKENAAVIPVTVYNTDGTATIIEQPVDGRNVVRVNGIVTAKDGLTVAIAGLISSREINNVAKVPILGDIPLVGELFTRKQRSNTKSEMILLITPRIISNPTETEDISREVIEPITNQEW